MFNTHTVITSIDIMCSTHIQQLLLILCVHLVKGGSPTQENILKPKVHLLGNDTACIAYTRISQYLDK